MKFKRTGLLYVPDRKQDWIVPINPERDLPRYRRYLEEKRREFERDWKKAHMLSVDSEMASQAGFSTTTGSSPYTFNFTNAGGTYIVIGITICSEGASPVDPSSVTYNSVAVTKITSILTSTSVRVWIGSAVTSATGSNQVSISWTGSLANAMTAGCITFTNQHATTPTANSNTHSQASGTQEAITVSSTTSGNICVAVMSSGGGSSGFNASSGTLSWRANVDTLKSGDNGQMNRAPSNGGTVTLTGDWTGADQSSSCAVEIVSSPAGAGTDIGYPINYHR